MLSIMIIGLASAGTTTSTSISSILGLNSSIALNPFVTSLNVQVYNQTWLNFDGVNDLISFSDKDDYSPAVTGNMSFCLWFKPLNVPTPARNYIFGKGSSNNYEYALSYETSDLRDDHYFGMN